MLVYSREIGWLSLDAPTGFDNLLRDSRTASTQSVLGRHAGMDLPYDVVTQPKFVLRAMEWVCCFQ